MHHQSMRAAWPLWLFMSAALFGCGEDSGADGGASNAAATSNATTGATEDAGGTTADAEATDAGDDAEEDEVCGSCLPPEGIPELREARIREFPVASDDACDGVCVSTQEGPGRCLFPEQPGVACDHKEKGLPSEVADPLLADEPYLILDGSGGGGAWCSDCMCDGTRCRGQGTPFERKRSRIYAPSDGPTRDELFLFLGGTGGNCSIHKWISSMAAASGYRSICLAYVNDPSGEAYCGEDGLNNPETTCAVEFRSENIFGEDLSERLEIGPRNAIVGRLKALLTGLAANAPELGFDAYLDGDGEVMWEKVIVSGFSQGGGNAGILSQRFETARAVFFSKAITPYGSVDPDAGCESDNDCVAAGFEVCQAETGACASVTPTAYVNEPRATPPERSFMIIHERESAMLYSPETARVWGMDRCGDLTNVDGVGGDYGCSRLLTTDADPAMVSDGSEAGFHGSMGSDGAMSKDADGYPTNQRAYMYMMLAE